jgi:hypothetical protein
MLQWFRSFFRELVFAPLSDAETFEAPPLWVAISFSPKPDITAFELARIIKFTTLTGIIRRDRFEALPANVRRHYDVVDAS